MNTPAPALQSKSHYQILDGLRGVASIMVVVFHVFETFNGGDRFAQIMNHGYLAVDFFFLLSGFVVAYAYDDRWAKMTQWDFYKRRLIRLQPMLILGTIIGAIFFYFQGCSFYQSCAIFQSIDKTPVWEMLLVMLLGFTLLPLPISMDIRGWQEMHPLNGPAWSLFFEYIANILYAVLFRRFSKTVLAVFVFLFACLLIHHLTTGTEGDVIGGWSLNGAEMKTGFTRVLYPFFAGMLLCRTGKLIRIKGAFWICSLAIIVIFSIPRIGGSEHVWMNGLYESLCIIVFFPLIVAIGAGGEIIGARANKICKWLGDISYPIYITHYALIYTFTAWVVNNHVSMSEGLPVGFIVVIASIVIAYVSLKWFDEPVRNWLQKRFLWRKA